MFNTLIYQPILQSLLFLYKLLGNNLGLAIIALTLLVKGALVPFTLPSLKSAKKLSKLKPELDKLKDKYEDEPKKLQKKQLEFYQEHGINPAGGCLPYIIQFIILIGLYRVFQSALGNGALNGTAVNTQFLLWKNLAEKDTTYTLPIIAGLMQLLTSLTLQPGLEDEPDKRKGDEKEKGDIAEMATSMQQQMVFLMPAITVFFALQFPAGLALYWTITTTFSFFQQLAISGPGGLKKYFAKVGIKFDDN